MLRFDEKFNSNHCEVVVVKHFLSRQYWIAFGKTTKLVRNLLSGAGATNLESPVITESQKTLYIEDRVHKALKALGGYFCQVGFPETERQFFRFRNRAEGYLSVVRSFATFWGMGKKGKLHFGIPGAFKLEVVPKAGEAFELYLDGGFVSCVTGTTVMRQGTFVEAEGTLRLTTSDEDVRGRYLRIALPDTSEHVVKRNLKAIFPACSYETVAGVIGLAYDITTPAFSGDGLMSYHEQEDGSLKRSWTLLQPDLAVVRDEMAAHGRNLAVLAATTNRASAGLAQAAEAYSTGQASLNKEILAGRTQNSAAKNHIIKLDILDRKFRDDLITSEDEVSEIITQGTYVSEHASTTAWVDLQSEGVVSKLTDSLLYRNQYKDTFNKVLAGDTLVGAWESSLAKSYTSLLSNDESETEEVPSLVVDFANTVKDFTLAQDTNSFIKESKNAIATMKASVEAELSTYNIENLSAIIAERQKEVEGALAALADANAITELSDAAQKAIMMNIQKILAFQCVGAVWNSPICTLGDTFNVTYPSGNAAGKCTIKTPLATVPFRGRMSVECVYDSSGSVVVERGDSVIAHPLYSGANHSDGDYSSGSVVAYIEGCTLAKSPVASHVKCSTAWFEGLGLTPLPIQYNYKVANKETRKRGCDTVVVCDENWTKSSGVDATAFQNVMCTYVNNWLAHPSMRLAASAASIKNAAQKRLAAAYKAREEALETLTAYTDLMRILGVLERKEAYLSEATEISLKGGTNGVFSRGADKIKVNPLQAAVIKDAIASATIREVYPDVPELEGGLKKSDVERIKASFAGRSYFIKIGETEHTLTLPVKTVTEKLSANLSSFSVDFELKGELVGGRTRLTLIPKKVQRTGAGKTSFVYGCGGFAFQDTSLIRLLFDKNGLSAASQVDKTLLINILNSYTLEEATSAISNLAISDREKETLRGFLTSKSKLGSFEALTLMLLHLLSADGLGETRLLATIADSKPLSEIFEGVSKSSIAAMGIFLERNLP